MKHRRPWPAYAMLRADGEIGRDDQKGRARHPRRCASVEARAPGVRHASRSRPGRLSPLRLRPVLDRQPLAGDRRRSLCGRLLAGIDPLSAGQEIGRGPDPGRRGRARADDAACRAGDRRAGQSLFRLSGGRAAELPARNRSGRQGKVARGAAFAPGRSRRSLAIRFGRSPIPSFAPAWNRLRAESRRARRRRSTVAIPVVGRIGGERKT